MLRSGEEILADIDATLDQLVQNAEALHKVSLKSLEETEITALQKTQESLLARVIHMELLLDTDQKKMFAKRNLPLSSNIQKKIVLFERLNSRLIQNVASTFEKNNGKKRRFVKKPRVHRNKRKEPVLL